RSVAGRVRHNARGLLRCSILCHVDRRAHWQNWLPLAAQLRIVCPQTFDALVCRVRAVAIEKAIGVSLSERTILHCRHATGAALSFGFESHAYVAARMGIEVATLDDCERCGNVLDCEQLVAQQLDLIARLERSV